MNSSGYILCSVNHFELLGFRGWIGNYLLFSVCISICICLEVWFHGINWMMGCRRMLYGFCWPCSTSHCMGIDSGYISCCSFLVLRAAHVCCSCYFVALSERLIVLWGVHHSRFLQRLLWFSTWDGQWWPALAP